MSQNNSRFKLDAKTIITAIVVIALIYLVMTGKISLFGSQNAETQPAPTEQGLSVETLSPGTSSEAAPTRAPAAATKAPDAETTKAPAATQAPSAQAPTTKEPEETTAAYVEYHFRNSRYLNEHYEKHGKEMGFANAKAYEKAASDVINNPDALHKTEKEDGDFVYYVEATNEFVILSPDGYIRTYFLPNAGKKYYDRQ